MIISVDDLTLNIDPSRLKNLQVQTAETARKTLSDIWGSPVDELGHYLAIFFDKKAKTLQEGQSFISLSFMSHGYVTEIDKPLNHNEAKKQIEIDLEIINRESQWKPEESIYFANWWPVPHFDKKSHVLEFGVALKDHRQIFNRTLNRILLTRYGHLLLNYSLSEQDIASDLSLTFCQSRLDEVQSVISVASGFRYEDIDVENDRPSRSKLINLILSSEIF